MTVWLQPDIWPPLDKAFYATILSAWHDSVWAPRVVTFALGLLIAGALVWLAWELYKDKAVMLVVAVLGAIIPYRLVFAVSTMGEGFFFLPTILAASFLARWLRDGRRGDLVGTAVALAVATTARYEAWFLAAAFGVLMLVSWWRRTITIRDVITVGIILSVFPIAWLTSNALDGGDLRYLSITRQQAAVKMPTLAAVVRNSAGFSFLRELILGSLLVLGIAGIVQWTLHEGWRRQWVITLYAPMAVITATTILTRSVPFAAPWRLGGVWLLLTLPIATRTFVDWWRGSQWVFQVAAASLLLLTLTGWTYQDIHIATSSRMTWDEVGLATDLARNEGTTLVEIEPGIYQFLDLVVASGRPSQFELTRGTDPVLVGVFSGQLQGWEASRPDLVSEYAKERFDLTDPGDVEALRCTDYRSIAVTSDEARRFLRRSGFEQVESRAGWTIFRPTCPEERQGDQERFSVTKSAGGRQSAVSTA